MKVNQEFQEQVKFQFLTLQYNQEAQIGIP